MSDNAKSEQEFEHQLNEFLQSIKVKNARLALSSSIKLLEISKLTKKGIPMALSKLVLATYLNKHFGEDFYINFKSYIGEIEDFEIHWEEAKKIIVLDILDIYRGLSSYLKNDYFTTVNPFKQIAEYLNEDDNIKLANINRLLMLCYDCSSTIGKTILSDIASIGLKRIINSIQVQKEGNYNEKHLEKSMTFIKNYVPKEQQNDLNIFLSELMFEFAISDSITKKAAALQNFTGFWAFSQETIEKLNEYKVVDHLIADLHQDLVPKFVTFFIKMWNSGQFFDEQLEKFWNVCVNEHQTIIDKFFTEWPRLFSNIPKEKIHFFWEIVIKSPKYPKAALDFLIKVAPKAEDVTKCKLITSLSNCEEKIDCVYAICEYAKMAPTISQAVISNAYTGLHEGKNKYFHILILLNLLKEPTIEDLGHVLDYGKLDPKESRPLFELILKICRILNHNLTQEEFDKLKILIEPVIVEDSRLVTLFLNQLILNHIIDTTLVHILLSWLVSQSHVMTDFIFSLFLFINNLDNNNQFDNFDLVGFQSILTVLKNSDDPEVATFMTNLIMRCRNNQIIDNLIVQIMEECISNAALMTISNLIYQIETILVNPPKCNKFEYSPLITIKLTDKGSIMIPFGSTVDFFKRRVGSFLNTDFNQLQFFIGEDPLTDIHHFTANEEIAVKSPIFGSGARKWSKSEYPSTVLAKYSGKLFDIVKANSKESENALAVLNLLPTIESESNIFKSKTPNWKEVFDTKYPYVLLYRMNILSHLINLKNRRDITYIFTSGGFKYLLKLIIDNKSIFSRPEHVDLFACSVGMLVASVSTIEEAKGSKMETYNSLGYKEIMDSLIIWVHNIKFEERSYSLMVQNIMFIICDIARYNADPLLENENFVDIFKSTIFDNRYYLQEVFGSVIASTDMNKIESIILSFVEYARNGNCLSYFKLVKKLAQISDKPVEVWKILAKCLMDNMFIMSPNAKIPDDFGHEKLYPKNFNKPKNKKGKKKPKTSTATDDESNNINSIDSKSDRSPYSSQGTRKSPSSFDLKDVSQENNNNKIQDLEKVDSNNINEEKPTNSEEKPTNSEENSDISNNFAQNPDNNEQNTQNNDNKNGTEQNSVKFAPNENINSQNKQEETENTRKRPSIFSNAIKDDKQPKEGQDSEDEEEDKEEVRYLHPGPQFTVEELREAALMMSANVADPMFVSCIFETLLLLVERVDNPIPYAEELCMFALNKIAFNVSRIIPAPHDLFDLIVSICNKDGSVGDTIFNRLTVLHKRFDPRGDKISSDTKITFDTHKGLRNLGCTCYINSSLQQLLRVPEVRDTILGYIPSENKNEADWLAELQLLFVKLLYFPCSYLDPYKFILSLKGPTGQRINVREQQDAIEFVEQILTKIDEKIPGKPIEKALNGKILHEIVPLDPTIDYHGETVESFTIFPLEIKDISKIEESFKIFSIPDNFTGKNKYNTDTDIGFIDAERHHYVLQAPDTFIFQLKRFDFDFTTLTRTKLNTPFYFPSELDISPIMKNPTKENSMYELTGVVMHQGNTEGGHYYSYCKDEEGWFEYNDHHVTQVDEEYIMDRAQATKSASSLFDSRNASGYLLFYRRKNPNYKKFDPICKLPAQKVAILLEDIQSIVLRNVILSKTYQTFINESIINVQCDNCYFMICFLIENFFSSQFSNETVIQNYKSDFIQTVISKLKRDELFCDYILTKSAAKNYIISGYNQELRYLYSNFVVLSIKLSKFDKIFIDDILQIVCPNAFRYWNYLDTIFIAITTYIEKHKEISNKEMMDGFLMILTSQFSKLDNGLKDKIIKESNLSFVFKAIRLIMERLPIEQSSIYQSIIMEKSFMNDWFSGVENAFEFGCLIQFYCKNNEQLTNKYLEYVSSNIKNYPITWTASHLSSCLTVNDDYTKNRLDLLFNLVLNEKNHIIVPLICKQLISEGNRSCEVLVNYRKLWLSKWLSTDDESARKYVISLIFALFPELPPKEIYDIQYGVYKSEKPVLDQKQQELINNIWDELMESNKAIISYCKYKGDARIGSDYFTLLTWATYYSGKVEVVDRLYICLYNNIDIFSKLKEKIAVYGLIQFLDYFISNQFAFFQENVLISFLKSLDKIPKKDDYYINFIIEKFIPMILVISQDYANIIVSSEIFYHSVKDCFTNDKWAEIMTNLTISVMNETTISTLCDIYFNPSIFDFYLKQNNTKFFSNIYNLFSFPSAVDYFVKGQVPEVTMTYLQNLVINTIYMKQILPLEILHVATMKFIANHKSQKKILTDPLNPIIEMWVTKGELLKVLFQELLDSSVPFEVAKKVAKIICIVFGGLNRFTISGLNLIHASDRDLYSSMEPSIRLVICVLRIDLINRYSQNKQDGQNFFKKDLKKLVEYEVFDTNIIKLYMAEIIKLEKFRTSPELANLVSQIFCQTTDLSIYKSDVILIFEFCHMTDDQQDFSVRHCIDLALSNVVEDSQIKDEKIQIAFEQLIIFRSFVDFMVSIYNRTPKISKRPPYKDIKCSDQKVVDILNYAYSLQ